MIQSKFDGLHVLQALMASEFVFMDDEILGGLDKEFLYLRDTSVITNVFCFITVDTRRVKPFLQRLGFEHFKSSMSKEMAANRSVKIFTAAPFQIYVTVIKDLETEKGIIQQCKDKENFINKLTTKNILDAMGKG